MIFDQFGMIRIINLKERKDRRRQMMKQLKRVGLANDPRVEFFDAIRPADAGNHLSIGLHGVFLGHLAILKEASEKGLSVLILEDDCDFTAAAATYEAPESWEIFYGGYYAALPDRLQESDIIGAHMMGFTADAARQVSDYFTQLRPAGKIAPIDGAYVWFRRERPLVKTLFAVPPIGNQRPSRTDIGNSAWFDRLPVVRDAVEAARRVRNAIRAKSAPKLEW